MGLPSGTKWAPSNVGAKTPEEAGLFFSWGNTDGHAEGSGYNFSEETYNATAAAAINSDLSLKQDMARANLGQPWRLPTKADFIELYNNCTSEWTTLNGVSGRLFTSNVNGNSIFLPAAGICIDLNIEDRETEGNYWSSSYYSNLEAHGFNFNDSEIFNHDAYNRRFGFAVRAVQNDVNP